MSDCDSGLELGRTGETDGADEANVDDCLVAETGGSKVDLVFCRHCHDSAEAWRGEEAGLQGSA
jgi:hypothetical protein